MSLAEEAVGVRRVDGPPQRGDGVGVLRPHVDVALARPDRVRGDRHALDQGERVALDDHPVRERAGVALVEVAGDELQVRRRLEDGLPLDAGREAGATATAQPRVGDLLDDLGGGEGQRPPEPDPATVGLVVGDRGRVDDADPREAHPALRGEPGVLVDDADALRVAGQDRVDVGGGDVRVADPAVRGLDLDERLEPEHAARAVAHDAGAGRLEGLRHLVGTDRDGSRVAGDVDLAVEGVVTASPP